MKTQFYPTKVKFVTTLLNHKFNNEVLHIHFTRKGYSLCDVIIINKATYAIHEARFGAFKVSTDVVGELTITDKNFVMSISEGKFHYSNCISMPATHFISYLEKVFIGVE